MYASGGGLLGTGAALVPMFRRAATFVDKILKGAKLATFRLNRQPSS